VKRSVRRGSNTSLLMDNQNPPTTTSSKLQVSGLALTGISDLIDEECFDTLSLELSDREWYQFRLIPVAYTCTTGMLVYILH